MFVVPLDHTFRFDNAGCTIHFPGALQDVDIACRRLKQQFGSWIEVSSILGTPCRAAGTVWSRIASSTEGERDLPVMYVVMVEMELVIESGQESCEAGIWNETRYYLVCAEQPFPAVWTSSVNDRTCSTEAELLTFEAVHRKPEGVDQDEPWFRRLYAQVRSVRQVPRRDERQCDATIGA